MIKGRDAEPADEVALERFLCRNGFAWADEVEEFVRASLRWRSHAAGRSVKVFWDDADPTASVLAVLAYTALLPADPTRGHFIDYLGVATQRQGSGLGPEVLGIVLDSLAESAPDGSVTWRVHVRNDPSLKMSAAITNNTEPTYPPGGLGYCEFTIYPQAQELPLDL